MARATDIHRRPRGRLWLSIRAPSERLRLPAGPATRLPRPTSVRVWLQPGGVDLISSARWRTFAAGGKFFPTADASIRRGWFGRARARRKHRWLPPAYCGHAGAAIPGSFDLDFRRRAGAGVRIEEALAAAPVPEATEVMTTPDTPRPNCGAARAASIIGPGPTTQIGAFASACAEATSRASAACWSATSR